MLTLTTNVDVGDGLIIEVKVECESSTHDAAANCAKKLKKAVDAVKKEFGVEDKPDDEDEGRRQSNR